jgi:signal transduction histidine kinase
LLGLSAVVVGAPFLAVVFLPVFDAYLLRQTERVLIAESVVVAEAWRDRWLAARGEPREAAHVIAPPSAPSDDFTPFAAVLDLDYAVLESTDEPPSPVVPLDPHKAQAGRELAGLLVRAQRFNLSGVRVLDEHGCVLAASRGAVGYCLADLAEVAPALAGRYAAVVRPRESDEPAPPVASVRRRGRLRVFTAIPVFSDGRVVAVVRMSRTAVSPLEAMYTHRGKVAVVLVVILGVTPVIVYSLSHAISRPVRELSASAERAAIADRRSLGSRMTPLRVTSLTPRELVRLGDAVSRMHDQQSERAQYVLELATQVSHELKTPIAAITGAVELLREASDGMSEAQRQRFLANMANDAERMDRTVRRLLTLARIESRVDEPHAVDVCAALTAMRARDPDRILVDVEPGLPALLMHADHFETAVGNLLDNALRHGAGEPVVIAAWRAGERIAIEVRDRGLGVRESQRHRIFDRFYTTERDHGGTGLGLALAKAAAEAQGGRLELVPTERGAVFRLLL